MNIKEVMDFFKPKQKKIYMTFTERVHFINRAKNVERMAKEKVLREVEDRVIKPINNFNHK